MENNLKEEKIIVKVENEKNKKIWLIIIGILLVLLSSLAVYYVWFREDKKDENKPIIYIYEDTTSINFGYYYFPSMNKDEKLTENGRLVNQYKCKTDSCRISDPSSFMPIVGNFAFILDGGYYAYNFINFEKSREIDVLSYNKTLDLDSSLLHFNLLAIDDRIYGVSLVFEDETKNVDEWDWEIYLFNANQIITSEEYDNFSVSESSEVVIFSNEIGTNVIEYTIIDINSGEKLHKITDSYKIEEGKEEDCSSFLEVVQVENSKNYYFRAVHLFCSTESYLIGDFYTKAAKLIAKDVYDYGIDSEGNLLTYSASDLTSFQISDEHGNISRSRNYAKALMILKEYVLVVDNDGYLKLLDFNDKEITRFAEWNDNFEFDPDNISGIFDDVVMYFVVKDNSISQGTAGHGKEYYYYLHTGESGVHEYDELPGGGYAKPVLYLYPEEKTEITVTFEKPNLLTTTYPKYKNLWEVTAYPNGDLYDKNNQYYYGLYWEETGNTYVDFKEGFYITKENAIEFLEEKLRIIGLNDRERNEFIMYWLPVLEKNEKSLVYFELTEEREEFNKIKINPKPDSLLRMAIHIKKVDKETEIKEQKLTSFERVGYTAIEWGGVIR